MRLADALAAKGAQPPTGKEPALAYAAMVQTMPTVRERSPAQATARYGNDSWQATGCSRPIPAPRFPGDKVRGNHGSCYPGSAWASRRCQRERGAATLIGGPVRNGAFAAGGQKHRGGAELSRFAPGIGPRGTGAVKLGQPDGLHGPHPLPALRRIGCSGGIALLRPRLVAAE
ncbi:MAG: hypothetical protein F4Z75_00515 [Synechococcus sp. SB0668_bin_15]|nr:hypothetical protein [Synechococcus sp. SB0668_bin_15]MXZ82453.1 hypothetical protein [Synechococcus sp. SB0666_bin_14]